MLTANELLLTEGSDPRLATSVTRRRAEQGFSKEKLPVFLITSRQRKSVSSGWR